MIIGAQLYTVRAFTKTPEALAETLKKVAQIGYTAVQISATCPFDAAWMKEELRKNGLCAPVRHYSEADITTHTDRIVPEDLSYGCTNIGLGYVSFQEYGPDEFERRLMPTAKRIRELGGKFAYHNHDNEFGAWGGSKKIIFDEILEKFPPELMNVILDVYWVQCGGADPAAWLEKLAGRTECIHLKDMKVKQKMAVVGEGNMNFDRILAAAVDTGVRYAFVEQDDCYGEDPFDCLQRSYAFLRSKGFN